MWDRDPVADIAHVLSELEGRVADVLEEGAQDLADVLALGTPVDTGAMESAWDWEAVDVLAYEVASDVPYADFVTLNTSLVPGVLDTINEAIGDAVSDLIEEA